MKKNFKSLTKFNLFNFFNLHFYLSCWFVFYFVGIILLKILKVIKKTFLKNLYLYYFVQSSNRINIHYSQLSYCLIKKTPQENQNRLSSYKFSEIQLITIDLASPEKIKDWAEKKLPNGKIFGQVTNPNTLHYKTLKPLKGGLFCERIFGPIKDFECACGIHKQKPFNRIISFQNKQFCPKCDVEYTWSDIRRYQLGYIELVTPITHLWYLKGMPSYIRSVLGAKKKHIEAIAYCSEIVTIDKAWKPNRFIPFPETISSIAISSQIKKTIVDQNEQKNFELIFNKFKRDNSTSRKIKYLNERFIAKRFYNTMLGLEEISNSLSFFNEFNNQFRRQKNFLFEKTISSNFYTIKNSCYKNQLDFYQKKCRSFIKTSLKNNKPIYALNLLYSSFSKSKVSFQIFNNFYNIDNIISFFNEELLNNRFKTLYIYKKYKQNKQRFGLIHSKKIHINMNKHLLYFNHKRLKYLQLLTHSTLLTNISNNQDYSKKISLNFKIKLLNKKLNFTNSNLFCTNFILLYFNIFSFHYFKTSNFFVNFEKFMTMNSLKFMKYNFFNIFILPIPLIIDKFILKLSLDSKYRILFNSIPTQKEKLLNSDSIIIKSKKTLKKYFVMNNLSVYEEASEILWQKFWKVCYFFTYNKINQKLRKLMKNFNKKAHFFQWNIPLSLKQIKKIIKKIKIDKIFNQKLNKFEGNTSNCIDIDNKFSFFVNLIKIYLKKLIFIYQIIPKKINIYLSEIIFIYQKLFFTNKNSKSIYFRKKIKNIIIKLFSLELLPWILSNFLLTSSRDFYKYKNIKVKFNKKTHSYLVIKKWNVIKKIKKSSFFNFKIGIGYLNNNFIDKYAFNFFNYNNFIKYMYLKNVKLKTKILIYKNNIENLLKFKKFRLFCKRWFFLFFKKHYGIRKNAANLNNRNLQNLNLLFFQKKWLLKKKQLFYNYALLKQYKSNFVVKTSNFLNFSNFIKLIYSSMYKNEVFLNIFSIQIKKCYKLNIFNKIQKSFNSAYDNYFEFHPTQHSIQTLLKLNYDNLFFKQFNYIYSFILFSPKISKNFFLSYFNSNKNQRFFLNLFCFFKFARKTLFNKFSLLKNIQNFFYSPQLVKYRKKQQKKSILQFVQKKIFFHRLLHIIPSFMSYYQNKYKLIKKLSIIQLISKKKMLIFSFLKKLQIKLISEIQKYYFYEFEKKKYFQIEFNINYFKNSIIFMNLKKKFLFFHSILFQPKTIFFNKNKLDILNFLNHHYLYLWFKDFFFISQFWQIIINIFKNQIQKSALLSLPVQLSNSTDSVKIESLIRDLDQDFTTQFSFNSFFIKFIFSHFNLFYHLLKIIKNTKNKILQTRQQYSKLLKANNGILINYFKNSWNHFTLFNEQNEFENNFQFFILYSSYQFTPNPLLIKVKKNNYLLNFYLKFIKHDLNTNFNEAIFSVISESRTNFNESIFWNNMYSLSNRYSWKSDIELNIFLCYMLSPENPSDILIPLYKQRIHSSNVLREEPPIAGGGIILKFLKELDLPEMKKIDIQLQTILKKIPNKLHEIEVLLKHYQTNIKFLKYYSLKRRTLIEIEKSILRKLKYIRRLNWVSAKPQYMIIRNLPVLPADLRPIFKIQQQLTASDLNRLYQKVMYRNDRLKRFLKNVTTSNSFEMLFAQRMLQEAVDNLIENGKDINSIEMDSRGRPLKSLGELLKGKKGRFRQNLLGKRVDYSGRSVIVVGPKLKLHECGLPIEMAIELFLPFLIKEILKKKYALTVRSAKVYIKKHRIKITQLLRQVVKRQPILLNRAPTLHRLGIQAFLPKLVEGKAILLHPLVCSAFNADFDGDQMAVHVPITNEARIEAWKLILSRNNLLSPATGEPILLPSQDMVLGCYYLTIENVQLFIQKQYWRTRRMKNKTNSIFSNFENIFLAYQRNEIHLHTNIWVKLNNNIESDSVLQEPTEIQVQFNGQYTKIYSDYYQKFKRNGEIYNQVIRTTPGRILFNLMLNNCFN